MWVVETLSETVDEELNALPADIRARFRRVVELIQTHGLERVREPHVKHLGDRLWEMRMTGKDGIARAIYVTASGRRVVVVRAFVKKTQKTPARELDLARKRVKGDGSMTTVDALHAEWIKDPDYVEAYGDIEEEFALATAIIGARTEAGLTQEQVAERMHTTQTVIARLESGRSKPSTRTLERFAKATGAKLKISFETSRKSA